MGHVSWKDILVIAWILEGGMALHTTAHTGYTEKRRRDRNEKRLMR
jgi:hypothetical protein